MPAEPPSVSAVKPVNPDLRASLGPPPLYTGENEAISSHLYNSLRADCWPRDAVEELYVRDAADYAWECVPTAKNEGQDY